MLHTNGAKGLEVAVVSKRCSSLCMHPPVEEGSCQPSYLSKHRQSGGNAHGSHTIGINSLSRLCCMSRDLLSDQTRSMLRAHARHIYALSFSWSSQ
jgi:hypothetical protein